jgi:carbon monoxide dehydrogenase subunit G
MDLTGSQTLNAPIEKVWDLILNPEFLAKVTPGITRLEKETDELYKAIAEIAIGPVKGKFSGQAELKDKVPHESFTMKVLQKSMVGNVDANIVMKMKAIGENQTELSFEGKANMSGLLARTGDRVMSGVANTLTKQFFSNFEKELSDLT